MLNKKTLIIIILLFICLVITPVLAATEASLIFSKALTYDVSDIKTSADGSKIVVALANASIIMYDNTGGVLWNKKVQPIGAGTPGSNNSIIKISVDDDGDVGYLTSYSSVGSITSGGTYEANFNISKSTTGWNVTDIYMANGRELWYVSNTSTTSGLNMSIGTSKLYTTGSFVDGSTIFDRFSYSWDGMYESVVSLNHSVNGVPSSRIFLWNTTGLALNFVSIQNLSDTAYAIDCYNGWCTISGDTHVFHQQVSNMGYGSQYTGSSGSGVPSKTKISKYQGSIEGRGNVINIYESDCTKSGTYTSGGLVRSVDISRDNGLFAAGGGDDGILYVFSKSTASAWSVYYISDIGNTITSVAISNGGEYLAVGRLGGTFELYNLQSPVVDPENTYTADLIVSKGGAFYDSVDVNITSTSGNASGITDATGKFTWTATVGALYTISINSGEYTQNYMGSDSYKTITVNIPVPLVSVPYQYASSINRTSGVVTSTYNDVNNANVWIRIYNEKTKAVISNSSYNSTTSVTNTYSGETNGTYKVTFYFTRSTGHSYVQTVYVYGSGSIVDTMSSQEKIWVYALSTLYLMIIGLGITSYNTKAGLVFLSGNMVLLIAMGFLPNTLTTLGITATVIFGTLLIVFRGD